MTECKNSTVRVLTVAYNGVNYDPIDQVAVIKLGGPVATDTIMTAGGKAYHTLKQEAGEIEFEIPWTKDFNPDSLRNTCGDLQILTDGQIGFLITNAAITVNVELKADGKVKLSVKGDVTTVN